MTTISGSLAASGLTITAGDLFDRFDPDEIGRLASDDRGDISRADVAELSTVATAISSGMGRFMAAVQRGNRYTSDDLASLTADSREYARDLICRLAMVRLMERRLGSHKEERDRMAQECQAQLDLLAAGKDVFSIESHLDAGLLEHSQMTSAELVQRTLRVDTLKSHLFAGD